MTKLFFYTPVSLGPMPCTAYGISPKFMYSSAIKWEKKILSEEFLSYYMTFLTRGNHTIILAK